MTRATWTRRRSGATSWSVQICDSFVYTIAMTRMRACQWPTNPLLHRNDASYDGRVSSDSICDARVVSTAGCNLKNWSTSTVRRAAPGMHVHGVINSRVTELTHSLIGSQCALHHDAAWNCRGCKFKLEASQRPLAYGRSAQLVSNTVVPQAHVLLVRRDSEQATWTSG